jgi:hypothetical protein
MLNMLACKLAINIKLIKVSKCVPLRYSQLYYWHNLFKLAIMISRLGDAPWLRVKSGAIYEILADIRYSVSYCDAACNGAEW